MASVMGQATIQIVLADNFSSSQKAMAIKLLFAGRKQSDVFDALDDIAEGRGPNKLYEMIKNLELEENRY